MVALLILGFFISIGLIIWGFTILLKPEPPPAIMQRMELTAPLSRGTISATVLSNGDRNQIDRAFHWWACRQCSPDPPLDHKVETALRIELPNYAIQVISVSVSIPEAITKKSEPDDSEREHSIYVNKLQVAKTLIDLSGLDPQDINGRSLNHHLQDYAKGRITKQLHDPNHWS